MSPTALPSPTAAPSPTPDVLADPDPDSARALEHIQHLSVTIGARPAGTVQDAAARDYIAGTLRSYGYEVEIQEFRFDRSAFLPARVDAGGQSVSTYAFQGSAAGSVTGPLLAAGIGRPGEVPATGAAGAVVLVERGELTFEEKVANARSAGAAGVIIYNNEPGPFRGGTIAETDIPVVALEQDTGRALVARLAAGPVTATVAVEADQATSYNIIARAPGSTACTTVTGGHYDSVPSAPGADDNASGTASVLEVARVVAANRRQAPHCFILFGAEEAGLIGSREYVQQLSDEELNALRAMVNLDVVGIDEPFMLVGSADLVEVARIEAVERAIDAAPGELPGNTGSDHQSFSRAGVPVLMLTQPDEAIHTRADAIDRMDAASLEDAVTLAVAALEAIAGE